MLDENNIIIGSIIKKKKKIGHFIQIFFFNDIINDN